MKATPYNLAVAAGIAGMDEGATTSHAMPWALRCRKITNPHGPAS